MAGNIYSGAAAGLESGFNLGMRLDQAAEEKRARSVQEALAQQQADRAMRSEDRRANLDEFQAASAIRESLGKEGSGLAQGYGSNVPADVASDYSARAKQANAAYYAAAQKLMPKVQAQQQQAQNLFSDLQAGNLSLNNVPPDKFYTALTASTGRPVADFKPGPKGEPSAVEDAVTKLKTGIDTGNEQYVLDGANTLLAPELMKGVGQESPHGGTIVSKRIVKFVPAPSDPNNPNDPNKGKVVPILRVFVKGDNPQGDSQENMRRSELEQQYGAPPGATGHYDAPVTQNRSTDPNDPVVHISMEQAMDRAMRLGSIASMMKNPQFAQYVGAGEKDGAPQADEFLKALYSTGGVMPTKPQFTAHNVPEGGKMVLLDNAGNVKSTLEGNPKPPTVRNVILGDREATQQWNPETKTWDTVGQAGPRFAKQLAGAGGGAAGGVNAALSKVDASATGDDLLKSLDNQTARLVKGVSDGTIDIKDISTRNGERSKIAALASQYGEGYNFTNARTTQQTEKTFATGVEGRKLRSFNVALDHLDTLAKAGQALGNGDIQAFNKLKNIIGEQTGAPAPTNFEAVKRIVADEVVSGVIGSTGALADREEAARSIMRASSPQQLGGTISQLQQLLGGQLTGLRQQYQAGGGKKDFDQTFLTPRARDFVHKDAPRQTGGAPSAQPKVAVGAVMQGYRFKGGDPAQQSSWEKVQ